MHHIFINENLIDEVNGFITFTEADDKEDFNHLVKVLRVELGEYLLCSPIPYNFSFDYKCKVIDVRKNVVMLAICEKTKANELPVKINLYQGLPKSDKLEFIVEKAVELGVYSITPVENEFSVVKMEGKKISAKIERLNKISKSAAEQSKRNIIPEVKNPLSFDEMLNKIKGTPSILFYENAQGINKTRKYIADLKTSKEVNIIIGPEGGFSDKEIEKAKDNGVEILSLGNRILRTETAAVAALSIFMYELQK